MPPPKKKTQNKKTRQLHFLSILMNYSPMINRIGSGPPVLDQCWSTGPSAPPSGFLCSALLRSDCITSLKDPE